MKHLFILFIPLQLLLFAQDIVIDELFHEELPPDIVSVDNPTCQVCHISSFKSDKNSDINTTLSQLTTSVTHGSATLNSSTNDSFSLACLHCHDGICAQNAPVKLPGCISKDSTNKNTMYVNIESHPIFNRYPFEKKVFRGMEESLSGIWQKAQKVSDILRDGKVVCISCHVPHFTKKTGFLRTSMKGSALCFGCHKK
ncbi:MAG: cytochrome c3 family protein [Sulfuricurvum sp.]|nr:cytochrome c3 family protein [Sulfuricurvum sp.]